MEFIEETLPNGLQIAAECNTAAHSAALGLFVRTGARDETDEVAGVSHFLEHMVFKGTPSRSADDVNREFDEMGAHYNAFTNEENTVYYAAILPEYIEQTVRLLADILRPSLREEDFNTEKQVIIEEIRMYDDQPPFGADDKCRAAYFGSHPLGRSVLGTVETIEALSAAQMLDYFRRRYSPGNIALVATGRVDFDALLEVARGACGDWEPVEAGRAIEPAEAHPGFLTLGKDISTQQYVLELAPGPSAESDDRFAAKLLATVLGDDSGSRLYWELVDPGRAEHASLNHAEYAGSGLMMTYLSCEPQATAENLQRILDVYRRAQQDGVTEEELRQARSKVLSRIVLSSERPRGRLFVVGSDWIYRQEYQSVRDDLDAISAVTLADLERLMREYPLTQTATVTISPLVDVAAPR